MPASELFLALKQGDEARARELISGGDVNSRGELGPFPSDGGATCLLMAIRNFDISDSTCELLLTQGADPNLADMYDEESPLQAFARTYPYGTDHGNSLLKLLLARGANPEQTNKHGDTALHTAASCGAGNVCTFLIANGADFGAKDRKGKTPLEIAPDVATQSAIQEAIAKGRS